MVEVVGGQDVSKKQLMNTLEFTIFKKKPQNLLRVHTGFKKHI